MAKYLASPLYSVRVNAKRSVSFDVNGVYSTEDEVEVAALDTLCPTWINRVDEPKSEAPAPEAEAPAEVKQKPARKVGNSSGK